jgi:solute carrier family 35 protein
MMRMNSLPLASASRLITRCVFPASSTLRRLTTLFTMLGEGYLLGTRNSRSVQASVWLMIFGAVIAGMSDFDYSPIGYALVGANCVFTAAYLLYIAKLGKSSGLNTFGLMFVNNIQSLPIVAIICILNGDFAKDEIAAYPYLYQVGARDTREC